jgi:hypothetical protein
MSEEQKVPTKDEIVAFLKEQVEVKELQAQLQDLNTRIAKGRAEEIQAISFVAQMTNPSQPPADLGDVDMGGEPHTITEEDLANNPGLSEQGLKVGDEVLITDEEAPKKRSLKKQK